MDTFGRLKPAGLLLGVILMIAGVIFLVVPDRVTEFLAIFTGALIAVFGLFRVILAIVQWNSTVNRVVILAVGILFSLIGIFMLVNPKITIAILGAIIGLFAIIIAFERFIKAYRIKEAVNTLPTVISGLIHLAFGIGMIYSAIAVFSIIIVLIGIYLMIAGIMISLSTLFFQDF